MQENVRTMRNKEEEALYTNMWISVVNEIVSKETTHISIYEHVIIFL